MLKYTFKFIFIVLILTMNLSCQKEEPVLIASKTDRLNELQLKWAEAHSGRWFSFAVANSLSDGDNTQERSVLDCFLEIENTIFVAKKHYKNQLKLMLEISDEIELEQYLDSLYIQIYPEMDRKMNRNYMDELYKEFQDNREKLKSINKMANSTSDADVNRCRLPSELVINSETLIAQHIASGNRLLTTCQYDALQEYDALLRFYRNDMSFNSDCAELQYRFRNIVTIFNSCPSPGYDDWNSPGSGSGGGGGGGNSSGGGSGFVAVAPVVTIDLRARFDCFNSIPDNENTRYRFTLHAQRGGSSISDKPGHAYITLEKTNGNQSHRLSYGFYPGAGTVSATMLPVPSAMGEESGNSRRYSDARYHLNLDKFSFGRAIAISLSLSVRPYDLNENNCVHYATNVFNFLNPPTGKIVNTGFIIPDGLDVIINQLKDNYPSAEIGVGRIAPPLSTNCN